LTTAQTRQPIRKFPGNINLETGDSIWLQLRNGCLLHIDGRKININAVRRVFPIGRGARLEFAEDVAVTVGWSVQRIAELIARTSPVNAAWQAHYLPDLTDRRE
jgi:hypothetical protein